MVFLGDPLFPIHFGGFQIEVLIDLVYGKRVLLAVLFSCNASVGYTSNYANVHFLGADSVGDCHDVGVGAVDAFGGVEFDDVDAKFHSCGVMWQPRNSKDKVVVSEFGYEEGCVFTMIFHTES